MRAIACLICLILLPRPAAGEDWPVWRHDAERSAATSAELPAELHLEWVRQLPPLIPAWPDQPALQFDAVYEPIVVGPRLFLGSSHDGSITAYDTRTGAEVWRFWADGPVRFAPLAWQDRLFFVSDDGYLYCLNSGDGSLVWRFRGGPSDRKILGNGHLISMWPARGAPVIAEDMLYFAAGIWPFMGIFLHALDARSGTVLWTNDGDGSLYMKQPHNTDSFAGVAPQGPLAVAGDKLLVPGGRSLPACYDRATGRLLYYRLAENGKRGGGSTVATAGPLILNGGAAFELETERYLGPVGEFTAFADGVLYDTQKRELRALEVATSAVEMVDNIDRKGVTTKVAKWLIQELGSAETPRLTALIKAGNRLYAGTEGRVLALALPLPDAGDASVVWESAIDGTPASLVAADDRLFVSTREGRLYAFGAAVPQGPARANPIRYELPQRAPAIDNETSERIASDKVASILAATGVSEGYGIVWGAGDDGLIAELLRESKLHVIVIEPDPHVAHKLRDRLRAEVETRDRVDVLVANPRDVLLPPYLASLMIAESLPAAEADREALLGKMFASLRPFGGVACLPVPAERRDELIALGSRLPLAGAAWKLAGEMTLLVREGPLPDSADWTHEHADAANTRVSKDKLVKAPLGLLWFGGSSNAGILPRHGHGPQPQVVAGRLFIEGGDMLRALDIYTGRVLWEASLPDVGALYDNTAHQPGANASGTNYIATPDGVYIAWKEACVRLDPATGHRLSEFRMPPAPGSLMPPLWGYLNVAGDYLVGGADPLFDPSYLKQYKKAVQPGGNDDEKKTAVAATPPPSTAEELLEKSLKVENDNYSSSQRLVVMDRTSGKVLWTAAARSGFRHNAICIGGSRMYCIDRLSDAQVSRLKRRGETVPMPPRLVVFDLATGRELWSTEQAVFGTWLSYSAERDLLVEAGRRAGDTLSDEPKGMRTYHAGDGSVVWFSPTLAGPAMIHHDTILLQGSACSLPTGAPRLREHPLSGEPVDWTWSRNYGCNTPAASEHLLTFRSGAAGYFDLCRDGGTGNLGGFRSSCTNNLIVAGGLLNAPEYTRTCTCNYQNQTSLALIHMPEAEMWTSFGGPSPKQPVRQVGINLGAPGDRKGEDGLLWLEYPSVGGNSPAIPIAITPDKPEWFRRHSSQIGGPGLTWVAASGVKGLTSLKISLAESADLSRRYVVRLHFLEPDDVLPGERVFGIRLQEQTVCPSLDVVKEAGGRQRALVKEFTGVMIEDDLLIELVPGETARLRETILSGIEIKAEGW